jgi:sulfur-carrier protein
MKVDVLFFGATADAVGKRRIEMQIDTAATASAVFERVLDEFPGLRGRKLLFSVNQEYAPGEKMVENGDELAIFTAVSGG